MATKRGPSDGGGSSGGGPPAKKLMTQFEPIKIGPIYSLEEMDMKVLQFQNKKLVERIEQRRKAEEELRRRIEQLEQRQTTDDAVLCIVNRYWNQLDEDVRVLLQRFDAESADESGKKNECPAVTAFLTLLSQWEKPEIEETLCQRVEFSKRAIGKLLQAYDRLLQRNDKLWDAIKERSKQAETDGTEGKVDDTKDGIKKEADEGEVKVKPDPDVGDSKPEEEPGVGVEASFVLSDAVREEMDRLMAENKRLQTLATERQQKHHETAIKNSELADKLVAAETLVAELKNQAEDLEYDRAAATGRVDKLDRHLAEAMQKLNNYTEGEIKVQGGGEGVSKNKFNELATELEEQRELATNRLTELEKLQADHQEGLRHIEKLKMDLSTLPEAVIVETTEYKCLQSQFSVMYNESMQIKTQMEEVRSLLLNSKNVHMRQIEHMEGDELECQKKLRTEVIQLEDQLAQVRREYEMLRIEFEQTLAANEQTGPINREMRNLITSLKNHNEQLKGEVARYKRKLKEAQSEASKQQGLSVVAKKETGSKDLLKNILEGLKRPPSKARDVNNNDVPRSINPASNGKTEAEQPKVDKYESSSGSSEESKPPSVDHVVDKKEELTGPMDHPMTMEYPEKTVDLNLLREAKKIIGKLKENKRLSKSKNEPEKIVDVTNSKPKFSLDRKHKMSKSSDSMSSKIPEPGNASTSQTQGDQVPFPELQSPMSPEVPHRRRSSYLGETPPFGHEASTGCHRSRSIDPQSSSSRQSMNIYRSHSVTSLRDTSTKSSPQQSQLVKPLQTPDKQIYSHRSTVVDPTQTVYKKKTPVLTDKVDLSKSITPRKIKFKDITTPLSITPVKCLTRRIRDEDAASMEEGELSDWSVIDDRHVVETDLYGLDMEHPAEPRESIPKRSRQPPAAIPQQACKDPRVAKAKKPRKHDFLPKENFDEQTKYYTGLYHLIPITFPPKTPKKKRQNPPRALSSGPVYIPVSPSLGRNPKNPRNRPHEPIRDSDPLPHPYHHDNHPSPRPCYHRDTAESLWSPKSESELKHEVKDLQATLEVSGDKPVTSPTTPPGHDPVGQEEEEGEASTSLSGTPGRDKATAAELRAELKKSQDREKELKLLLDMYKTMPKEHRDKAQLLSSERKFRQEADDLRAQIRRLQDNDRKDKRKLADDDALRKIKKLEEAMADLQRSLAAQKQEEEALLNEMEVTGQAFEDMQEQNIRLLQQLREKDDANFKLMSERIKSNQIHKLLREEKDVLLDQVSILQSQVEAQNVVVRKLEDKERILHNNIGATEKELGHRQSALDFHKRKAIETAQTAADLKLHLDKYQAQLKEAQEAVTDKTSALQQQNFKYKRIQEEVASLRRKVERAKKIEMASSADEVLMEEIREYKEQLTCPSCKVKKKNAVLTKCFHVFCLDCLKTRYETRQRKCPKCNAAFGANDYHRIYLDV